MAGAGIVWRTSAHKGSPFLRRRAPAPNTADHEGSPGGSCSLASHRETLRRGRKKRRSTERAWCGSQRSYLQVPRPGTAGRDAHTDQEGVARWASRRACGGVRDRGHAAEGGHGSRGTGAVRSLCGRYGAGARRRAWSCRIRLAACLCSPGSGCTTRTGRSCRCAGAWVRRTAGMPALGEP